MYVSLKVNLIPHTDITCRKLGKLESRVIRNEFYTWVVGRKMIPVWNYNTKGIAGY